MKLTRTQQVFVAVLALGLIVLILDKTVFGPSEAGGGITVAPPSAVLAPDSAGAARQDSTSTAKPTIDKPPVANQLRHIAQSRFPEMLDMPDAFHPSTSWFSDETDGDSEFRSRHDLAGVITGTGASLAMMEHLDVPVGEKNDRFTMIPVGEDLDGYTLIFVDAVTAVFERGDLRITFNLVEKGDK